MQILYKLLSALLSILFSFTVPLGSAPGRAIVATDDENVRLSFSVISDTHITDSDARTTTLRAGLEDMSQDGTSLDALVISGDLTDHGEKSQYRNFFNTLRDFCTLDSFVIATGNHDTWSDEGDDISRAYFVEGYNALTGRDIQKAYYSTVVNGYTFLVMASESDSTDAYISDEQISWLDTELAAACADGKPVFVVCHFPIGGTNGQPEIWPEGSIGEQSDAVDAVLQKYTNVFYITGHMHAGFMGDATQIANGYSSVESIGNVHYINVPCYMYLNTDAGNPLSGCGYVFEVYDDYVLLRARNFVLGGWMSTYDAQLDLV